MIKYDINNGMYYSSKVSTNECVAGFSTSILGDGRSTNTISKALKNLDVGYNYIIVPGQIHSANVEYIVHSEGPPAVKKIEDADGIVTKEVGTVLTVITADCVPIIYRDKTTGIIGISHQGWRGTFKKMPIRMIEEMGRVGAKSESIACAIGPAIGECCYEVGDDLYERFLDGFEEYSDIVFSIRGGRHYLNLLKLNYLLLKDAGIAESNIDYFPFCTKCDEERFFSARRLGGTNFPRLFSFIMKKN